LKRNSFKAWASPIDFCNRFSSDCAYSVSFCERFEELIQGAVFSIEAFREFEVLPQLFSQHRPPSIIAGNLVRIANLTLLSSVVNKINPHFVRGRWQLSLASVLVLALWVGSEMFA